MSYDSPKMFWLVILLNTLGKLIKKFISKRLQVQAIFSAFIYPNQVEELKQRSSVNTGLYLTHLIYTGWIKNIHTSILVFDVTQFFLSLNHQLLLIILDKVGFDMNISHFFLNYLINRSTQYVWNNFTSPSFRTDIDVGQRSALSLVFLALYITPIFHIFQKRINDFQIFIPIFSFVCRWWPFYFARKKLFEIECWSFF